MDFTVNPRARTRELVDGDVSPEWATHNQQIHVSRALRICFYPGRHATMWSVVSVDRQGHRRWERTIGVGDLSVSVEDLAGEELAECLRLLLRAALENLS